MRHYQITVNGRRFDVRVLSDPQQAHVEVEVDGTVMAVAVQTMGAPVEGVAAEPQPVRAVPAALAQAASPLASKVVAPLPGTIKSVATRPGQRVAKGDELLVIEAMKMDNLIRAPREGIIETVLVAEGSRVAHGELLLAYRE